MKNKKLILIIISFLAVVAATFILGKYFTDMLHKMAINQDPNNQFKPELIVKFYWRIYVQCFFVLFMTACSPFIFSAFSAKINKKNWWKSILVLEATGLLLIFITAPPDMISRIIIFIIWQLPVLINFASLRLIIRKKKNI
jgi:hypothetical protein